MQNQNRTITPWETRELRVGSQKLGCHGFPPVTKPQKPENADRTLSLVLYLSLGVFLLVSGFLYRDSLIAGLYSLESTVQDLGPLGPLLMTLVASLWAILCLPGPVVLGFIGTVYSSTPFLGLFIAVVADSVAEVFGFLVARHVGRKPMTVWLGKKSWFQWLEEQTHERGAYGVFVIRMMPFFPNSLANYAFGLSALRFWPYIIASILGSIPNLAVYIFGTAGAIHFLRHGLSQYALTVSGIVICVTTLALIVLQAFLRRHGRLVEWNPDTVRKDDQQA